MARIRTIKPEFFRHSGLYEAEVEDRIPLRIAFAGLWTVADKAGRFKWRPRELKLDCLPFDEVDFSRVLDALRTRGFIVKYIHDGMEYGHIPSWGMHQVINNRESESVLPDPHECTVLTREARVDDALSTPLMHAQVEGKGREGEGKGREGKGKDASRANIGIDIFPSEIPTQLQNDFIALRKAKKSPVTQTAISGIEREAKKAGLDLQAALEMCCQRGWTGFKAEWVTNSGQSQAPPVSGGLGKHGQATAEAAQRWLEKQKQQREVA